MIAISTVNSQLSEWFTLYGIGGRIVVMCWLLPSHRRATRPYDELASTWKCFSDCGLRNTCVGVVQALCYTGRLQGPDAFFP